jgi:hypothetical protein
MIFLGTAPPVAAARAAISRAAKFFHYARLDTLYVATKRLDSATRRKNSNCAGALTGQRKRGRCQQDFSAYVAGQAARRLR